MSHQRPVDDKLLSKREEVKPAVAVLGKPKTDVKRIQIKILKGQMTKVKADAIINTTNTDLRLDKGFVSTSLLKEGGSTIQEECRKKYPNGIKYGEVAVTQGGKLKCKIVCHGALEQWKADESSIKMLEQFVMECLKIADQNSCRSVAIPAMGTGNLKYPADMVAKQLYDCVENFSRQFPVSYVSEVMFVLFEKDHATIKAFEKVDHAKKTKERRSLMETFISRNPTTLKRTEDEHTIQSNTSKNSNVIPVTSSEQPIMKETIADQNKTDSQELDNFTSTRGIIQNGDHVTSSVVTFNICTGSKEESTKVIEILEKELGDMYIKKKVNNILIKELNSEEIAAVKALEKTEMVLISIDTTYGEIILTGVDKNVSNAMTHILIIIQNAGQQRHFAHKAKLVTQIARWYYITKDSGNDRLVEYPDDVNFILEKGFKENKPEVSFLDADKNRIVVDLTGYKELHSDKTPHYDVIRKSKQTNQGFDVSSLWTTSSDDENCKLVEIATTSQEYRDVVSEFKSTIGSNKVDFIKIERIQNKTLYRQFMAKKEAMASASRLDATTNNEKRLWHGCGHSVVDAICKYGFNRSYCLKYVLYGEGVYFAVNVHYSIGGYAREDDKGHKRMFLCRVLTGQFCNGKKGIKVPPPIKPGSHILFDSLTDNQTNPSMFIIFHDSQAYPEYLFTFTMKK